MTFPSDIELRLPQTELPGKMQHFLLEIPWDQKYLSSVPDDMKAFFVFVLPYLHVRTTDVHVAICLGMLEEFCRYSGVEKLDRRVVGISLILHDCGWSRLSQKEVAESLGVTGLQLSSGAVGPKEKHVLEGERLARELLDEFEFQPQLSAEEKDLVLKSVRFHDKPWEVAGKEMPPEVQLLVDLDHIWSFTHENFWQDTERKGVSPEIYAHNLEIDLDGYFVTGFGRLKAKKMLQERKMEISVSSTSGRV